MKKVCFSIPCYNEEENIELMTRAIDALFQEKYKGIYEYVIEYIDNYSTDRTREVLQKLCERYPHNVRAIFNTRNFGGVSSFYGLLQTEGDCSIVLPCDFQVPISIIDKLLEKWKQGACVVCAVKKGSKESGLMWNVRKLYYKLVQKYSEISQIQHFTGAGLYDAKVVEWLNKLDDPVPSLRGMVAEYGCNIEEVYYVEEKRKRGKSKHNFSSLFSVAIKNIILYTDLIPNFSLLFGIILCLCGVLFAIVEAILKISNCNMVFGSTIAIVLGMMILFGIQFVLMGLLGRYLSIIHKRIVHRPLVVEEKRLNF